MLCNLFFRKYMNVHHIHRLFYKQDEENRFLNEDNCLSTEISKENASKRLKSLNAETLKKKKK